ncbi:MAG: endopeptidase La [Armatimonadetes bacterium]|nr:endopeptidase La [Armatimonadota bacterium]
MAENKKKVSTQVSAANPLPVLALRNSVLFPHGVMPITVGRERSKAAVVAALEREDQTLTVFTQRTPATEDPLIDDLYWIGTRVVIRRIVTGEEAHELVLQAVERVRLLALEQTQPYLLARLEVLAPVPEDRSPETEALHREMLELSGKVLELAGQSRGPVAHLAAQVEDAVQLAYFLASALGLSIEKEQTLLEISSRRELLEKMNEYLRFELQVLELRQKISNRTMSEMTQEQKEHVLRRQMRAIREELGEAEDTAAEIEHLRARLEELELPEEVAGEIEREIKKLERLPVASPDHQVTRTYLDMVLELPWKELSEDNLDLKRARQILEEDHHGLEKIKERILEHLAVMKLNPTAKAPILCFVGPPGVGKTSLGQSIARALGRKFERMSLGGLHDEAELRGHRRTYIGAMPGRLIQALRRAGTRNPVLMLDEIDKLGLSYRGDPAAALLEVIDPAQNDKFRDNYIDLPFDLSKTFFILTANSLDPIPSPLRDRMEILQLSGYSEEEKLSIARQYLLPRQLEQGGLRPDRVTVEDEAIRYLISRYTREAGVRNLERALGKVVRKLALRFAEEEEDRSVVVDADSVPDLLGPERFTAEKARQKSEPGVTTGLAWTPTGGDILYVEAILIPGAKELTLTGQLGDVMRESARAAQSYILARAQQFRIPERHIRDAGVHIHVPAGAIPKDGPSAGITIATALASAYTGVPIRTDVAMTGEITLTGLVLPVGGIKEKVLGARRRGLLQVILPRDNDKDLRELPKPVREEMTFHLVETLEEVLEVAAPELARRLSAERDLVSLN